MKRNQMQRREFLKIGGSALAMIPVMAILGPADAATNATLRASLKYQDKPDGDKRCDNCLQFVPGASAKSLGSCRIIPGDTEISPQGYCTAWTEKA